MVQRGNDTYRRVKPRLSSLSCESHASNGLEVPATNWRKAGGVERGPGENLRKLLTAKYPGVLPSAVVRT